VSYRLRRVDLPPGRRTRRELLLCDTEVELSNAGSRVRLLVFLCGEPVPEHRILILRSRSGIQDRSLPLLAQVDCLPQVILITTQDVLSHRSAFVSSSWSDNELISS